MKAVILAGGKASKLVPFASTRPIPMLRLAGRTLFDNSIDLLQKSGVSDIFVVVEHQKEKVIERIGEHRNNGLNLHYVEQGKSHGIGNAILKVKNKISPGSIFF